MTSDPTQKSQDSTESADALSGHILEQGEIDGLLKGANSDHRGLRALVQSSTVTHERLPMLEVVFDRLVRMLSTSLRNFTSDNVDVSLSEMTSIRYKDYIESIDLPAMMNVIKIKDWDTNLLLTIDNSLIYTIVDVLLGGRREERQEVIGRVYTTIERTLNEDFIQVLLNDLTRSFEPIQNLTFAYDRMETNPHFVAIERSNNTGIVVRLHIKMDDRGGQVEMFIPYSSIEPIRGKLLQSFVGEKFGNDKIWENHLAHEVWNTKIRADALLDQVTVKLSEVLQWKVGSFLPLETFEGANIVLKCGDRRLYSGKIGNVRKRVAVQIEENYLVKEDR